MGAESLRKQLDRALENLTSTEKNITWLNMHLSKYRYRVAQGNKEDVSYWGMKVAQFEDKLEEREKECVAYKAQVENLNCRYLEVQFDEQFSKEETDA